MRKSTEFKSPFLDSVKGQYELMFYHDIGRIGLIVYRNTIDKNYSKIVQELKYMLKCQSSKVIIENGTNYDGYEYHLYQFA